MHTYKNNNKTQIKTQNKKSTSTAFFFFLNAFPCRACYAKALFQGNVSFWMETFQEQVPRYL